MRQFEIDTVLVAVHDDQHRLVVAMTRHRGLPASAVEQHAEAFGPAAVPVGWLHRGTIGVDPGDVAYVELLVVLAGEETATAQNWVIPAQLDELPGKGEKLV